MKFLTAGATLALVSTVCAAPNWSDWVRPGACPAAQCPDAQCPDVECPVDTCLQQSDAEDIVNNFIAFLDHPDIAAANVTAQALLAEGFYEKSDSINMLAGHPIGSVTFEGKQSYIGAVLSSPSLDAIEIIKIFPAGCDHVLFYWRMGVGSKQIPVQGFNLFEIVGDNQIGSMFVEFNNIGWGIDIGYTAFNPAGVQLPLA
ncbi:hypothetical protein PV10_02019 [Exophiala mesophila]|uniref:NTF2-like domain-containing protein n=1 Tax=Exophiala mesophila TaxID=212818 RepID=A0A0D1ZHY3_EXOME|nr:uncharacterized protein PV10_02019 [Exophiala mesophila]KIV94232.1 hypothetical protein PV10_02019 [Exophiala mesophila]